MVKRASDNTLSEVWKLIRPKQWAKNIFVFFGLLLGQVEPTVSSVLEVCLAALVFSLCASGIYVLNDLADRKSDRRHPKKRFRPLAAGTVSAKTAALLVTLLWLASFVLAYFISPVMVILLAIYVALNVAYSFGLKHVVYVDVAILASGYILRLLSGTLAVGYPPSGSALLSVTALALFLGFTKRRVELAKFVSAGANYRRVLEHYSLSVLNRVVWLTAVSVVLSYILFTLSPGVRQTRGWLDLIVTAPFVIWGVGRYLYLQHKKEKGDDPTSDILRDPLMVFPILGWLVVRIWLIAGFR